MYIQNRKFKDIWIHHPLTKVGDCVIVDSINKKKQKLDPWYHNLREKDIANGYLLCYHYRIISKENSLNK